MNEWIFCKDRLPIKTGKYLTWMQLDNEDDLNYAILDYDANLKSFGNWYPVPQSQSLGFLNFKFYEILNVIAWMELPEPPIENSLEKEIKYIQNKADVIQQKIKKLRNFDTYKQYDNSLKEILHVILILNNIKNKKIKEIEDVIKGITICFGYNPKDECCDCPYYNKETDFCSDGDKKLSEDILDWIYFYNWVEKQWKKEIDI